MKVAAPKKDFPTVFTVFPESQSRQIRKQRTREMFEPFKTRIALTDLKLLKNNCRLLTLNDAMLVRKLN